MPTEEKKPWQAPRITPYTAEEIIHRMGERERQHKFKVWAAVQTVNLLTDAIEQNNNVYSGSLVPNLQSVLGVLRADHTELVAAVKQFTRLHEALREEFPEFLR